MKHFYILLRLVAIGLFFYGMEIDSVGIGLFGVFAFFYLENKK